MKKFFFFFFSSPQHSLLVLSCQQTVAPAPWRPARTHVGRAQTVGQACSPGPPGGWGPCSARSGPSCPGHNVWLWQCLGRSCCWAQEKKRDLVAGVAASPLPLPDPNCWHCLEPMLGLPCRSFLALLPPVLPLGWAGLLHSVGQGGEESQGSPGMGSGWWQQEGPRSSKGGQLHPPLGRTFFLHSASASARLPLFIVARAGGSGVGAAGTLSPLSGAVTARRPLQQ